MNGRRVLVAGGMLLVLSGLLYSLVYLIFFAQPLDKAWVGNLELALDMAMKGQPEMARGYAREMAGLGRVRLIHWLVIGHLTCAGLTALAVSSFVRALELKKKWEKILSYLLLLGGAASPAGYFVQLIGYGQYGRGLSMLGHIWQLTGVAGYAGFLALYMINRREP